MQVTHISPLKLGVLPYPGLSRPATAAPGGVATLHESGGRYAIIDVGGSKQLVEEGRWYTAPIRPQAQRGSLLQFNRVVALKDQRGFTAGMVNRIRKPNICLQAPVQLALR